MRYAGPLSAFAVVLAVCAAVFGLLVIASGVNGGEGGGYIPYIPHVRIAPADPEDEPGTHTGRIVEEPVHVGGER